MGKTGISWTDETWNPVTGCSRVSPGCANCYAFSVHNRRYRSNVQRSLEHINPASLRSPAARHIMHDAGFVTIAQAMRAGDVALPFPAQYDLPFAKVQLLPERLTAPLQWKRPRRVFVCSMSDLFHRDVPDLFILEVWLTMAMAREHTFQVLTKRPERMRELLLGNFLPEMQERGVFAADFWPLPNVWIGTSVEDQERADERIPILLETPAAVRFISAEPLLGPVDLRRVWRTDGTPADILLNWVIAGGESGDRVRSCDLDWLRSLRDQCTAAGVAFHLKQLGGRRPGGPALLDGREWKEFPDGGG